MSIDKDSRKNNIDIAKSAGVIGIATLFSRILGFFRDIVIARLFGVYIYAQAFVIAFKIPNLFRDFVGEGATNSAFVPVFSEYKINRSKEEFWELANVVFISLAAVVLAITVLGIIFSPFIIRLVAPGFIVDSDKFLLTVKLNRLLFPYLLLICLAAYTTALLNSLKHFSVPAFAPCLLNISIIIFAFLFGEGVKGLALGVLIGGVLQLAVQVPVLYKKGFRLRWPARFNNPGAKLIGKLMIPRLLSSSIYQLNNFVDTIFGSLAWAVGEGGVAVLYFSYRLIQFPIGIFSNALSQAILPAFSQHAAQSATEKIKESLSFGIRMAIFVMVPASVFFMALSKPLVFSLFSGGRFDSYSVSLTAKALFFYSIGLSAYGANKILQACFFSLKDTLTPAKISALSLAMNIVLNSILMFPLKIGGIALATSISGVVTFFILLLSLKKKIGDFSLKEISGSFLRISCASLGMGVICFLCSGAFSNKFINLSFLLGLGMVSYFLLCFMLKVRETRDFVSILRIKKLSNRHYA